MDYLTLVGDASDNIRGAKGIGPKTAAGILNFFGSVDEIYSAIDVGSAGTLKPAQLASLEELRPRLEGCPSSWSECVPTCRSMSKRFSSREYRRW